MGKFEDQSQDDILKYDNDFIKKLAFAKFICIGFIPK